MLLFISVAFGMWVVVFSTEALRIMTKTKFSTDGYGAEGSEDENQVVRGLIAFLLATCLLFDDGGEDKNR